MNWKPIEDAITGVTGDPFSVATFSSVGGGCISSAFHVSSGQRDFFIKLNTAALGGMFEAEFAGLEAMAATASIRVPRPVIMGESDGQAWFVMEYIEFGASHSKSQAEAGELLATMHRATAEKFGWQRDNTIGSTPQINCWQDSWIDFWREQRLGVQLRLAANNGYGGKLQARGERLLASVDQLIDHAPMASLLHGDLWGGNIGYDSDGRPVIFDPAVYYGDREADIAMTELFGGFGRDFYAAYQVTWPLDQAYKVRKKLYNLYHVLNHLNLFGSGYRGQAEGLIEQLLSEIH